MTVSKLPSNYPGYLYKCLKSKYAELMLSEGSLQIGTLIYFRGLENDAARGDKAEGCQQKVFSVKEARFDESNSHAEISNIFFGGKTFNAEVQYGRFTASYTSEDYYIYCMMTEFDTLALAAFEADVCVRIDDPMLFLDAITYSLGELTDKTRYISPVFYKNRAIVKEVGYSQIPGVTVLPLLSKYGMQIDTSCDYGFRDSSDWTDSLHPVWIKDPSYKEQKEARAVWTPTRLPIEPDEDIELAGRLLIEAGPREGTPLDADKPTADTGEVIEEEPQPTGD